MSCSKKKSLCIAILILVAVLAITAFALLLGNRPEKREVTESFLSGSGHPADPYRIYSVQDFLTFAQAAGSGKNFQHLHVAQMADLDFSAVQDFIPVSRFAGTYNGNGHIIRNLHYTAPEGEDAAIFLELKGAVIHLGVEDSTFSGLTAGSISGPCETENAVILNCYSNGKVSGLVAGGIAPSFSGQIVQCFFYGKTEGLICGGIAGGDVHGLFRSTAASLVQSGATISFAHGNSVSSMEDAQIDTLKQQFHANVREKASAPVDNIPVLLFSGGHEGSIQDPYRIYTVDDLCLFRTLVNSGVSFDGKYLRMENDLDLSSIANWTPIGPCDGNAFFWGTLDGNGHVIRNLTIHAPGADVGFFGALAGEVLNLGIESGSITGHCIGSFTSREASSDTILVNCYSKADLYPVGRAGGIVDNAGSTVLVNCYFGGTIHGERAYGMAGYTAEELINCHAAGYPLVSEDHFDGTLFYSEGSLETASTAAAHTNAHLYAGARRATYLHRDLYRFDANGTFKGPYSPVFGWILRMVGMILLIVLLLTTLLLLWHFAKHKIPFTIPNIQTATKQFWSGLKHQLSILTATRSSRIRFLICSVFSAGMLLVLVALLCGDTHILYSLVCSVGEDAYMDFFNTVMHITGNKYDMGTNHYADPGATYPPLANLCFWLCGLLLPHGTRSAHSLVIRASSYGAMMYLWLVLTALILFFLLFAVQGIKGQGKYLLPVLVLFSPTFLFSYERGNVIMIALLFSVIFVLGYRSDNPFIRHLSYISLAIATAIKIYPVLFGLLLLREKNIKHIIQCVTYGILFFVFPFAFCGGITGLQYYILNVTSAFGNYSATHGIFMLNYGNITMWLSDIFCGDVTYGQVLSSYTTYPLVALIVVCFFLTRSHWKQLTALTLVQVLYPGFSHYYTGIFYAIPLFAFMHTEHTEKKDYVYAVFFSVLLAPYQFLCGAIGVERSTPIYVISVIQLVLVAFLFADCLRECIQRKKDKTTDSADVTAPAIDPA